MSGSGEVLEEGEDFWVPLGIPAEFPYEFGPDSPAESVLGSSTETESDEDELTHLLTRSTLQDTARFPNSFVKPESNRDMASSPKSTLSRPKTWPCRGPVTGPVYKDGNDWGLLFSPTDVGVQAARAKTSRELPPEAVYPHSKGFLYRHTTNQVHLPPQNKIPCSGFFPKQHEQMMNYQELKSRWILEENRQIMKMLQQSAWPNLHPELNNNLNGRGMKPVFLSGVKRERTGTGVFLPRRYDTNNSIHNTPATNPRKKPSCSTVLMPAKVIQSLNLNIEDAVRPSQSCYYNYNVGFEPNYDAFMARRNAIFAQQKRNLMRVDGVKVKNHEVHLPKEWTY